MKGSLNDIGLAILRIGMGALMITHGYGKFNMLINGGEIRFPSVLGMNSTLSLILAVFGEFIAPILIVVGFKTKIAAIPAAITMAVAAFIVHGSDPLAKKELALLYLIGFLAIAFLGGGKHSIDGMMNRR
ncbi:DoxX family protein [Ascidiimonas sp. W6]|uniref:DoxX family protein n=1 Tax=Ascidiimonas meishanensis TaxID=3128903 RepID=UPI0030ECD94E